jgi:hypothetical protein
MSREGPEEDVRMVSRLKETTYEKRLKERGLTSLEKQRHRLEIVQTYKIVMGKELVERETWFQMAADSNWTTGQAMGYLNLRQN